MMRRSNDHGATRRGEALGVLDGRDAGLDADVAHRPAQKRMCPGRRSGIRGSRAAQEFPPAAPRAGEGDGRRVRDRGRTATDGLIERRDQSLSTGLQRLCDALRAGTAEMACSRVIHTLIGPQGPSDDVALLSIRRTEAPTDGH
jgi:hypothetical protein